MSHEDFRKELNALRESLPEAAEEAASSKPVERITYSLDLAKRIVDEYAQGKSIRAISHRKEMPAYGTLLRWAKEHPELSKMLRSVRDARALHFEDAAIEAAESASGKDADRLKFEAYKWGAEVNDPTTYGKKVQASHEVSGKVVVQVVTGFGPPNAWQTSPKLRADGTIEKEVISEVVSEAGPSTESSGSAVE